MSRIKELLRQGRFDELWQMCCGFIDLDIEQFMAVQQRLLLEQIELYSGSALKKKIIGNVDPETVEEFRQCVPLTTYADYCPELAERREEILPTKPVMWLHTSGRSQQYPFDWVSIKWTPMSRGAYEESAKAALACAIFSSCKKRGDTSGIKENMKFIYAVAPRPYTSGAFAYIAQEEISRGCLPPVEEAERLSFEDRMKLGFEQALSQGFDFFFGVSIVLLAIGEKFNRQLGSMSVRPLLWRPRAMVRVIKGLVHSKLERRPLQPKDLWPLKGIIGGGSDSAVFKEKIRETWGRYPLDIFVSTEGGIIATQTWDYSGMTFLPHLNFLEFIPEEEYSKSRLDSTYVPGTLLLNEVKAGEQYEVVITNFHGGSLVRYRTGDVIRITSLRNEKLGIDTPQMMFVGRVDDIMDIGGFVRLTEKVIWQAVENSGIPYVDWTACKEAGEKSVLHLYIEVGEGCRAESEQVAEAVYEELRRLDDGFIYGDMNAILGSNPIKVNILPPGSFTNYVRQRQAEGADLAHLKPTHINPNERVLALLNGKGKEKIEARTVTPNKIAVG